VDGKRIWTISGVLVGRIWVGGLDSVGSSDAVGGRGSAGGGVAGGIADLANGRLQAAKVSVNMARREISMSLRFIRNSFYLFIMFFLRFDFNRVFRGI
jgi:hypothetical protein